MQTSSATDGKRFSAIVGRDLVLAAGEQEDCYWNRPGNPPGRLLQPGGRRACQLQSLLLEIFSEPEPQPVHQLTLPMAA